LIGSIEGVIGYKQPAFVRILCQGIGYDVHVPMSTYERLGDIGDSVQLRIHLHVKEDALQLYGFHSDEEKAVFLKVIGVRGIGPKIALGILSSMPVLRFVESVQDRDIDVLAGIPGVGRKTAERLAVDLKDQFPDLVKPVGRTDFRVEEEEAIKALVALGFSPVMARRSVREVLKDAGDGVRTEELVRKALATIR
jgi:Holliday junction DNA helicase RuvA